MRVLILYTELAGYFLACIRHLLIRHNDTKILLVHYPVNAEAPFAFSLTDSLIHIEYKKEKEKDIHKSIIDFKPDMILCSGWGNSFYLKVIRQYRKSAKTVVFVDNQWHGSLKQYLLRFISPFYLIRIFRYAWVPGQPQRSYALKLGFKPERIFTGLYVADTNLFKPIGSYKINRGGQFPRIIISVARYIAQKDLPTLWKAFTKANQSTGNEWVLNCFGFGELFGERIENPYITHMGFKQPAEMEQFLLESGVYVLPSLFEPWGVAVHEMALSAMPMILSESIGSVSMFLDQKNGFTFKAGDVAALQNRLEQIMTLSDEQLWAMAANSLEKGKQLELDDWVKTFIKIAE